MGRPSPPTFNNFSPLHFSPPFSRPTKDYKASIKKATQASRIAENVAVYGGARQEGKTLAAAFDKVEKAYNLLTGIETLPEEWDWMLTEIIKPATELLKQALKESKP